MSWSKERARRRINGFLAAAPVVRVERYEDEYLPRLVRLHEAAAAAASGRRPSDVPPLFDLPDGAAVLVDTVQVYVRLLNYDDYRLERGQETAASHAKGLAVLHTIYGAADRVVEDAGAQRVDYHGARLHAVVIEPRGRASAAERIAAALELAEGMVELARLGGREFLGAGAPELRFRIGIDAGPCVAMNSGRSDEREPLFVGPAANHAAKLAMGDIEGVFLSDRVRANTGLGRKATLAEERSSPANGVELAAVRESAGVSARTTAAVRLDEWKADARAGTVAPLRASDFVFHQHTPPLRGIDYAQLMPSRSIRMPLAAVFADLDGYTAYIDRCMATGRLGEAVRVLHVLRSELATVVQSDFGGRKVRFIGDCILGILAEGTAQDVDVPATIRTAALCVGALRSSFLLCGELMPEARGLGLAIGFETGDTPVSRIGIRGDRSVRVASSLAVRASEACQRECGGRESRIGPRAFAAADGAVRSLFSPSRTARDLDYDDVATQLEPRRVSATVAGPTAGRGAPAILRGATAAAAVAAASPARAYVEL